MPRNQNGAPVGTTRRKHSGMTEVDRIAQEDRALDLKRLGLSDRQIATELGVNHATVQNRLTAALSRSVSLKADEYRTLVTLRLENLWGNLQAGIAQGDSRAVTAALGVLDRLAKIHGLDAPIQHEVVMESEADREIKTLLAQIATQSSLTRTALESS